MITTTPPDAGGFAVTFITTPVRFYSTPAEGSLLALVLLAWLAYAGWSEALYYGESVLGLSKTEARQRASLVGAVVWGTIKSSAPLSFPILLAWLGRRLLRWLRGPRVAARRVLAALMMVAAAPFPILMLMERLAGALPDPKVAPMPTWLAVVVLTMLVGVPVLMLMLMAWLGRWMAEGGVAPGMVVALTALAAVPAVLTQLPSKAIFQLTSWLTYGVLQLAFLFLLALCWAGGRAIVVRGHSGIIWLIRFCGGATAEQ